MITNFQTVYHKIYSSSVKASSLVEAKCLLLARNVKKCSARFMSVPGSKVLGMDLFITILSIPIVATTAFIFGRNPYCWALYAYFLKFWVLIPLFLIKKYPTPPVPPTILKLAGEVNLRRELRKIKTPEDLGI